MHSLVDLEQYGFIKGHKILDNILAFNVGRDFVKAKKLRDFLLKLEFWKAYDRLDHFFLVVVLKVMGFSDHFIMLIKGLVCNGTSKVHLKGIFTGEIELGRGVGQGCLWILCCLHYLHNL